MKPPESRNAKKSVPFSYFPGKTAGIPNHCSFQHPQQLRFHSPKLIYNQFESHTNNLHLKKNLVRIRLPYQKLLNFDRKKSKFPTVWREIHYYWKYPDASSLKWKTEVFWPRSRRFWPKVSSLSASNFGPKWPISSSFPL